MPAAGDENVGRLDVAVNDAFRVRRIQRVRDFDSQRQQKFLRYRAPVNAMLQRHSFQKFHGDKRMPVLLADIVNGADVGMIQRRGRLRLALKAGQHVRVSRDVWRQEF